MWKRLSVVVVLALLIGAACQYPKMESSSCEQPDLAAVDQRIDALNQQANDTRASIPDRAKAIFALFKYYVKPNEAVQEIQGVLKNPNWLDQAKIYSFTDVPFGGWIPVEMNSSDRTYSLLLFPGNEESTDWVIYFRISGRSREAEREVDDAVLFLRGKVGTQPETRIKEFALCYPDGLIEMFTRNGVRSFNLFGTAIR